MDLARKLKKTMKHESDGDANRNRYACYSHQRISKRNGEIGNRNMRRDHLNYSIIKISKKKKKKTTIIQSSRQK